MDYLEIVGPIAAQILMSSLIGMCVAIAATHYSLGLCATMGWRKVQMIREPALNVAFCCIWTVGAATSLTLLHITHFGR